MKNSVAAAVAILLFVLVALSPAIYTVVTGDFPGANAFYGQQEDSQLAVAVLNIHNTITGK